ncbi:MAG: hypothetical protein JSU87_04195 [Gemmatimonadota bacterium]|nr:MAG: hypothetical protein JSU87_04195 [Gemmatimonadota bacterium]
MNTLKRVAVFLWYAIAAFAVLAYIRGPLADAINRIAPPDGLTWDVTLDILQKLVGLALVVGAFYFVRQAARSFAGLAAGAPGEAPADRRAGKGLAFPAPITVHVAVWLLFMSAVLLVGLLVALDRDSFLGGGEIRYALITMFAAGVGSMITTILGYLKHASVQQDFNPAFAPWYVARPIMGILLGVIFYFVLKGGLLATVPDVSMREVNEFGLAGLGGLVGLFSKNAIEKLREVFNVLFKTGSDN